MVVDLPIGDFEIAGSRRREPFEYRRSHTLRRNTLAHGRNNRDGANAREVRRRQRAHVRARCRQTQREKKRDPDARDHGHITTTTLPCALRSMSNRIASPARASGMPPDTGAFSLPSAIHLVISVRLARPVLGSRAIEAPQNTPTISQPLSSVRLSGTRGISPAAKPITR